jgi:hypothetical protein
LEDCLAAARREVKSWKVVFFRQKMSLFKESPAVTDDSKPLPC